MRHSFPKAGNIPGERDSCAKIKSYKQMVNESKVVIAGGGIIGCSVAYHLTLMGWKEVVLLEKDDLTCGSTWHAAGLVGQLRSSRNVTQMLKYSVDLYNRLEEETGLATGFKPVGGLRVASSEDRLKELKRSVTMAKTFGLPMDLLNAKETHDLFPPMSKEGIQGGANLPTDGFIDPNSVTQALAKGARSRGAQIYTGTTLTSMTVKEDGSFQVVTDKGEIHCDYFVNCGGLWAYELGQMVGVNVPIQGMEHQYMISEKIEGVPKDLPTMRDPDNLVYYKEEARGLLMGGYEHHPLDWASEGMPEKFSRQLLAPNFEHFEQVMEPAIKRTPALETAGIVNMINGPEAFTPDGNPVMGEAPEVKNYFVAAGFNAFGIASGGGAGKAMAEWIINGSPSLDLWQLDICRFGDHHKSRDYVRDKTKEGYAHHYSISWPSEEFESCRPLKTSPLYSLLKERGAVFGSKFGWERPNWFAPEGVERKDRYSFEKPNWFEHVGREHRHIRTKAAVIDQTSFSKFEVEGAGALDFLQYITDNQMDKPVGAITYTQMLTEKGGIACDLTVTRTGEQTFYITTGTAFGTHDLNWIRQLIPKGSAVAIRDITGSRVVLNLCGPESRKILQSITRTNLDNDQFPYLTAREIFVGYAPVLAQRVTYVGELGWELHVPVEYGLYLYNLLWEAGKPFDLINAGYRVIESLRLEKGYRYWSADITPDYTPLECGLGFCVKYDKGDFMGKEALLKQKEAGIKRKLCTITIDDPRVIAMGKEAILLGEEYIGYACSAGYGYTVEKSVLFAYLPIGCSTPGTRVTVEIATERFEAVVEKMVLYDPKNEKVKG